MTQLGNSFLSNCTALQTLDLSGLTTVQRIGTDFLIDCILPTSSINVTGSSSVVSEYVNSRSLIEDSNDLSQAAEVVEGDTKCKCVCM